MQDLELCIDCGEPVALDRAGMVYYHSESEQLYVCCRGCDKSKLEKLKEELKNGKS